MLTEKKAPHAGTGDKRGVEDPNTKPACYLVCTDETSEAKGCTAFRKYKSTIEYKLDDVTIE